MGGILGGLGGYPSPNQQMFDQHLQQMLMNDAMRSQGMANQYCVPQPEPKPEPNPVLLLLGDEE